MFNFFKKKPKGQKIKIPIEGMHCTSCALNIDDALEDIKGVFSSETSYARSEVTIEYDPKVVSETQLESVIISQGYQMVDEKPKK